jgi:2-polyprenyl-3-methyl-5-hydroxy-6-metoxy-1,4-benzoquinol methylase
MIHTVESERAKYDKVWQNPVYRIACHSLKLWQDRRELFPSKFSSALDIGCGLGSLVDVWNYNGIDAWGVDISRNSISHNLVSDDKIIYTCLWEMEWNRKFDFGICTDVMEHIPEEFVHSSLAHIAACCNEVLFKIAHEPNSLDGEMLHLTRKPARWWIDKMNHVERRCCISRQRLSSTVTMLGTEPRSGCHDSLIRWSVR